MHVLSYDTCRCASGLDNFADLSHLYSSVVNANLNASISSTIPQNISVALSMNT